MRIKSDKCSKCKVALRASNARYCLSCKAAYMRTWRPLHPLVGEAKARANARSYLHMNVKRGKVIKLPCSICTHPNSQASFMDYSKPLEVIWICKTCKTFKTFNVEQIKK